MVLLGSRPSVPVVEKSPLAQLGRCFPCSWHFLWKVTGAGIPGFCSTCLLCPVSAFCPIWVRLVPPLHLHSLRTFESCHFSFHFPSHFSDSLKMRRSDWSFFLLSSGKETSFSTWCRLPQSETPDVGRRSKSSFHNRKQGAFVSIYTKRLKSENEKQNHNYIHVWYRLLSFKQVSWGDGEGTVMDSHISLTTWMRL